MLFKGVSRVLQRCFKGCYTVARVIHGCFKVVTRVLLGCTRGVTKQEMDLFKQEMHLFHSDHRACFCQAQFQFQFNRAEFSLKFDYYHPLEIDLIWSVGSWWIVCLVIFGGRG